MLWEVRLRLLPIAPSFLSNQSIASAKNPYMGPAESAAQQHKKKQLHQLLKGGVENEKIYVKRISSLIVFIILIICDWSMTGS